MKAAFSLIELMVVIVILGLLAMFVLPNLTGKSEEAKQKLTCIQMKSIAQALKMYKIDNSSYPSTEEKLDILVKNNFFEDDFAPQDSWGNDFIYTSSIKKDRFELVSFGADKKESSEDNIYYSKCKR